MAFFDTQDPQQQQQQGYSGEDISGYDFRSPMYNLYQPNYAYSGFNNPLTSGGSYAPPGSLPQVQTPNYSGFGSTDPNASLSPATEGGPPQNYGANFSAFLQFLSQLGPLIYGGAGMGGGQGVQ